MPPEMVVAFFWSARINLNVEVKQALDGAVAPAPAPACAFFSCFVSALAKQTSGEFFFFFYILFYPMMENSNHIQSYTNPTTAFL